VSTKTHYWGKARRYGKTSKKT